MSHLAGDDGGLVESFCENVILGISISQHSSSHGVQPGVCGRGCSHTAWGGFIRGRGCAFPDGQMALGCGVGGWGHVSYVGVLHWYAALPSEQAVWGLSTCAGEMASLVVDQVIVTVN